MHFRYFLAALALFGGLLFAPVVLAHPWEKTISSDAVATYLPSDADRVLVITAGERSPDLNAVRETLVARINRVSGATAITMRSLNGTQAEDEALLKKASQFSVDVVLIVRVFSPESNAATAVATFYDSSGKAHSAFALERTDELRPMGGNKVAASGDPNDSPDSPEPVDDTEDEAQAERTADESRTQPSAAPDESPENAETEEPLETPEKPAPKTAESEQSPAPSEGVNPNTADTIAEIQGERQRDSVETTALYEHGKLTVQETEIHKDNSFIVRTKYHFFKGVYKEELTGREFLQELGRDDLVDQYDRRKTTKTAGIVTSAIVTAGGAILLLTSFSGDTYCFDQSDPECVRREQRAKSTRAAGFVITSAGSAGIAGFMLMNPFPIDGSRARRLAYNHNQGLRRGSQDLSHDESPPTINLSIGAVGKGAGLRLGGRF